MKNKPQTLKEFIVAYIAANGPTQASVLRRAMYAWKRGTMDRFHSGWYASYFATRSESSGANKQGKYGLWQHVGKRNSRGEFRPAILTLTAAGWTLAKTFE